MRPALLLIAVILHASVARATYSVVAADKGRQQVGGAGASCVAPNDVSVIFAAVPGQGAAVAQADFHPPGRDLAAGLLAKGTAPVDVIRALSAPAFDPNAPLRQYGVVSLAAAAGFTGSRNGVHAGDKQGSVGPYVFSVQGNILSGAEVIDKVAAGFQAGGCDLAERLMAGLEAGAAGGGGDARCVNAAGNPANSAFVRVVTADGAPLLNLNVTEPVDATNANPLPALRKQLNAWRVEHPCPGAPATPRAGTRHGCSQTDGAIAAAVALGLGWILVRRRDRVS